MDRWAGAVRPGGLALEAVTRREDAALGRSTALTRLCAQSLMTICVFGPRVGCSGTMIEMPEPAVLPLGAGREGATVRVHPLLTGEILAPPAFFKRPDGPLGLVGGLGLHVPPRRWRWCPIPAFLVEHPSAGRC